MILSPRPPPAGSSASHGPAAGPDGPCTAGLVGWLPAFRFAETAAVAFLLLAVASTLASPNLANSINGLVHGLAEPIAMGAILVWLRPSPRGLVLVAAALAASIALGSLIDILQAIKAYGNLTQIVNHRLLFTEVTYDNVGLFGVIVATILPFVAAVLLLRRDLGIPRWASGCSWPRVCFRSWASSSPYPRAPGLRPRSP